MHKKCFNETSVKFTTSETHKTQIKHVSNPTETYETKMKRMNRLKHGSWFAGISKDSTTQKRTQSMPTVNRNWERASLESASIWTCFQSQVVVNESWS